MNNPYKNAGVDIDAGDRLVSAIAPLAKATARPGADAALGGFGGLFDLKGAGFSDPLLVSGADGVGTKLKIAFEMGVHNTVGIDLVAMCANDVLAQGAEPLFFLDYFATGKLEEGVAAAVVSGIAEGCKAAGAALIGGETAEMPGMYGPGEYDLAGFCVGAVERQEVLPRQALAGDVLIGLPSSGAHSNGFSLIRKIIADENLRWDAPAPFLPAETIGDAFLAPTKIYVKSVLPLTKNTDFRAFAHITGGGLTDNVPRIIQRGLQPRYSDDALTLPPMFEWLKKTGNLTNEDMRRTFNCGIGGVCITSKQSANDALELLSSSGENARVIGDLIES